VRFELDGAERDTQAMDVSLDPIANDEGAVTHLLLVVRPAGEARRRQAALGATETLMTMGRYATRMAHEINNPLASIKNSFLLVKEGLEPTHPYYRYVGAIDRELNRLTAISQQLYDVYRLSVAVDAGTTVAAIVADVVDMLGQRFRSTPIDVALDPSVERTLPVPGLLLRQVVYTILLNALEIAPAGGPVVVRGVVRDDTFVFTVHGRGTASPLDLLRRVTEPAQGAKRYTATIDIGLDPTLFRHATHAMGARLTADEGTDGGELRLEIPALAVA
jgi:signal transduction histidine kinase